MGRLCIHPRYVHLHVYIYILIYMYTCMYTYMFTYIIMDLYGVAFFSFRAGPLQLNAWGSQVWVEGYRERKLLDASTIFMVIHYHIFVPCNLTAQTSQKVFPLNLMFLY